MVNTSGKEGCSQPNAKQTQETISLCTPSVVGFLVSINRHRQDGIIATVCVAGLILSATYAIGGGGNPVASAVSPDRTYRVDWVTANRLDRLLHATMSNPVRIELHDNISGRLVGTGEVVDADAGGNGKPAWLMKDMGVVSVGPGAQFLHVPPLSPDGHPLAIDKELSGAPH